MAVHNNWGMKTLQELGFERVVLPREMTVGEIQALHRQLPEMELEVFIHGAQCYGFSGLCLASGLLLGRSGNRGDCGQICRTWFSHSEQQGYFFSCNDLYAGQDVTRLIEAGAVSLKIEGRMKSPAYAAAVSRLYRHILDGKDSEDIIALEEEARVAYARKPVKGHLFTTKGQDMINTDYPSHLGVRAGSVKSLKGNAMEVETTASLAGRDGLMFFDKKGKAFAFSTEPLEKQKKGTLSLKAPRTRPAAGTALYKISSHNHHWKELKPESYKPFIRPVPAEISLTPDNLTISVPQWDFIKLFPLSFQESRESSSGFREKLEQELAKSAGYTFRLVPELLMKEEEKILQGFIPPSQIKKMRQEIYKLCEEARTKSKEGFVRSVTEELEKEWTELISRSPLKTLPQRKDWFSHKSGQAYVTNLQAPGQGPLLPLSPLQFPGTEEEFKKDLTTLIQNASETVVGLNNWGHIGLLRTIGTDQSPPCVIDAGLLTANRAAYLLLAELMGPKLTGCYGWIEAPSDQLPREFTPIKDKSAFPLFISRNCFMKHSLKQSCGGCNRRGFFQLDQNGKPYTVIVEDCLSWVYQGKRESSIARDI